MLVKSFNKAWEEERKKIEERLTAQFQNEIDNMDFAIKATKVDNDPVYLQELLRMRAKLLLRKALVGFESEEIARQRMQLRTSYLALFMSSLALIVSVTILLFK